MDMHGRALLRVAVGGYLIYLAWKVFSGWLDGGSDMNGVVACIAAAVLALAGAVFCGYAVIHFLKEKRAESRQNTNTAEYDEENG